MKRVALAALTAALLTLGAVNAALTEAYLIQTYAGNTSVVVKNVQISLDDSYYLAQAPSQCETTVYHL
jgi:expansin (peptidoglycan-binding protein)